MIGIFIVNREKKIKFSSQDIFSISLKNSSWIFNFPRSITIVLQKDFKKNAKSKRVKIKSIITKFLLTKARLRM